MSDIGGHKKDQSLPLVRAAVAAPVIAALRNVNVEPAVVLSPLGLSEAQTMDPLNFISHDNL